MILAAHSYFLGLDPKQVAKMKPYPPLATLLMAAQLRERGHPVALFDAMLAPGPEAFLEMLERHNPTMVCIQEDNFNFLTKMCTVRMREAAIEMIDAAHARGCRVAVNGSDATDRPALYLAAGADAVVLGDDECAFVDLAEAWRADPDAPLEGIPGLALPGVAGDVRKTAPRGSSHELDALPPPAWDLVDVEAYRRTWTDAHGYFSWNMATSRGCPYGCNWCAKPVFGRRYAQRTPASVAEELRRLKFDVGVDHVWFADDLFGLTARWIGELAEEIHARDARIPFMIQCRADLISPSVARALAHAGCEEVWMGVESGSQRILDAMDKGTTVEEVLAATSALKSYRIRACWFLQLGYPGEQWDDVIATRDLVRRAWPDDVGVSVAYPLPGTKFHAAVRDQLGARTNWEETGDLAMLFQGTYTTPFYRRLRDALHAETASGGIEAERWFGLAEEEVAHRSLRPTEIA
ncbi:MAG TPA: radical SAM protein, partial [Longimicrobium sp.]|nr:radical SAM protein [Longimicrobium sp.]